MVTYFPQKTTIFCICLPKMGKMDIHIWDFFFCYASSMKCSFIITLHFSKRFIHYSLPVWEIEDKQTLSLIFIHSSGLLSE